MPIEILESRIAPAMVITVATLSDSSSSPKLTLRAAIAEAGAGDTIIFAQGLHGAIKLSSPLVINTGITIDGLSTPGKASVGKVVDGTTHNVITVSGTGNSQIFDVEASGAVTINNLNFTAGQSSFGGAIYDNDLGGVTITGSSFVKNEALGVSGSAGVSGGGGAIAVNAGNLILSFSKLSGNDALGGAGTATGGNGAGGAVYLGTHASGIFHIDTFSANAAFGGDGASVSGGAGRGGAIYSYGGSFTVQASTFSGNIALGGRSAGGYKSVSVHVGAGGGAGGAVYAFQNATVGIHGSAFKHNGAKGGDGLTGAKGTTGATGIVGGDGAAGGYSGYGAGGAVAGEGLFTIDSSTITGNIAVGGNGGNGGAGGHGGSGQGSTKPGVGGAGGKGSYGGGSYGGAVAVQNSASSLILNSSIISGNAAIPGKGGKGGAGGAGSHSGAHGNSATSYYSYGGAVDVNVSSSLYMGADSISKNAASIGGGVHIYNAASAQVAYSTISSNHAIYGGGIALNGYNNTAVVTVNNSTISGNKAFVSGGGFDVRQQSLVLQQSTVANNSAGENGGGLNIESSSNIIENSTIAFNKAGLNGGGVDSTDTGGTAFFSTVVSNDTAGKHGSGVDVYGYVSATYSAFGVHAGVTISNTTSSNLFADTDNLKFYLEALHNNGGTTETILFQDTPSHTSALLNAGSNTVGTFPFDQRGSSDPAFSRTQGTATDIGAVEVA